MTHSAPSPSAKPPRLQPYPEYKDSGVEWLGEIPTHWEVERLKSCMDNIVEQTNLEASEGCDGHLYIAMEHVASWTGRLNVASASRPPTNGQVVKGFRTGDILFGKLRPYLAKVLKPDSNGVCVGEFLVLRPRRGSVRAGYMEKLLRSKSIIDAVDSATYGTKMPRAEWQFLGGLAVVRPPLYEQRAIADFLDRETAKIDALVAKQEQLIDLLQEKRTGLITCAVTRGLDPDVPIKDSGIGWLGDIPAHWEVKKLKHLTRGTTVGIVVTPSKYYVDEGVPCLRSLNVSGGAIDMENLVFISDSANELHRKSRIFSGDVVVVRTGQAGTAAVVPNELDGANCIDLLIVRRSEQMLSQFVYYYLNSGTAISQAREQSVGAIQAHYNTSTLAQLVVPKIPLDEQNPYRRVSRQGDSGH